MMKNNKTIKHLTLRTFVAMASLIGVFALVSFKYVEPEEKVGQETKIKGSNSNDLKGKWVMESNSYMPLNGRMFYKEFGENGTFTNSQSVDNKKTVEVTHQGKYEMLMPGIYVENLLTEDVDQSPISFSNVITYKKKGKKLELTFKTMGTTTYNQVWKKVSK